MGTRGGARRAGARGPLAASVAAVLVGVAGILAGLLFGAVPHPRDAPSAPPSHAPAEPADESAPGAADEPAPGPAAAEPGIDPDWLTRTAAATRIPRRALLAYAEAAARLSRERPDCGLGWNTLAGIGFVESEHGAIHGSRIGSDGVASPAIVGIALDGRATQAIPDTDGGALDGDAVWDRAVGPMQFIPSTWGTWRSDGDGDGRADPHDIDDAAYSAGRYLCVAGHDLRQPEQWIRAIAAYNAAVDYNNRVADAAGFYARASSGG